MALGIVLVPALIVRLPADYFVSPHRHALARRGRHPLVHLALTGAKNCVGAVFVVAGLLMFILPGQGLITMLAGLMIMNYPGKFALERWIVRRKRVMPALNWLRTRLGHPPLAPPLDDTAVAERGARPY